jgi:hypothetical protein
MARKTTLGAGGETQRTNLQVAPVAGDGPRRRREVEDRSTARAELHRVLARGRREGRAELARHSSLPIMFSLFNRQRPNVRVSRPFRAPPPHLVVLKFFSPF